MTEFNGQLEYARRLKKSTNDEKYTSLSLVNRIHCINYMNQNEARKLMTP